MDPARTDDSPQRRLVDRWARLEQQLTEDSTRRIHEFERRLEHEWEALRQLHEDQLKTRAGVDRRFLLLIAGLGLALIAWPAVNTYFHYQLANRAIAAERAALEAQDRTRRETARLAAEVKTLTAETRAANSSMQRMMSILAAVDLQKFPLAGGRTVPAAVGQALWSRSRGLLLSADRIPPPTGATYQVWLVTTRALVSLGFVTADANGRLNATFDVPPALSGNVVSVLVTTEPPGGSVSPRGRVLLTTVDQ